MTAIRVLRVIARMNVGGPALQVTSLMDGLDPARFEQRLLVGRLDEGEADFLTLRAQHLRPVLIPGLGRSPDPFADIRALRQIGREIRAFRPHIVHTHTAKAGVLGRTAAVLHRAPVRVHTYHGHLLHGYFSPGVTRLVTTIERAFARVTTRLVAVGDHVRKELLGAGIGKPDQYVVVPPGVKLPTAPSRVDARRMLGLPIDSPVVAHVARLTWIKRPDRFVEVARRLAVLLPTTHFVVAGEGPLLAELRAAAAPLGDRVHFLGWRSDVETVYASADVVLLTSDNEGMPVSLIEASSVGCPAVTTRVGSTPEVVIDGLTGFVADSDPEALADATIKLLLDPELRSRFATAAAVHAQKHFSRDRLVADIATLYEDLDVGITSRARR